jgi:hypothetical protein
VKKLAKTNLRDVRQAVSKTVAVARRFLQSRMRPASLTPKPDLRQIPV